MEILRLANNSDDKELQAEAFYIIGKSQYFMAEYDSAIIYLKKTLNIYEQFENQQKIAELYDKIGSCYYSGKNATKDKFFSIIAHDLRSPLSSLSLVTEVLDQNLEELDKEKTLYLISSISKAANNLLELVENLLNWARTQTGKITFEPEDVNISQIIKQNISLLKLNADKKEIRITNNIATNIFVLADINLITTVIRNLLSNAIKFTDQKGSIKIDISEIENYYKISISDTGIGISEDNLKKLFRIDIDTRQIGDSAEKGTGLGLILCKEFIEKNKGTINVESEIGIGTTFSFTVKEI